MAAVVLEHLTKVYANGVRAVHDLSLQVADGEFLVLVGPSGCGKTTTLRLIAGLEEPTAGSICIGGRSVNAFPPHQRDVAMVFQRSVLYPHLDVRRNLSMSLRLRRRCSPLARMLLKAFRPARYAEVLDQQKVMAERVNSTARLLGLQDIMGRIPGQLSGGQQQRVALGRAIVRRPGVFLLDEPLSHLDGQLRAELRHELHLLQHELRATMIYVTHDQAEAMTLADRVAVMERGVVQQVDRPQGIYERPGNRFVAGFLGWPPMNFVDGQLLPKDGRLCFAFDGCWLPLPGAKGVDWQARVSRSVTLGIRPEDIQLAAPGQEGARLSAEVVLIESLGHSSLVTLRHGDWQGVALVPGPGAMDRWKRKRLEQESMVEVSINMEHVHLFDRSTGLALNNGLPAG
jgi:multiple sugar transport system ATP-binding protein